MHEISETKTKIENSEKLDCSLLILKWVDGIGVSEERVVVFILLAEKFRMRFFYFINYFYLKSLLIKTYQNYFFFKYYKRLICINCDF